MRLPFAALVACVAVAAASPAVAQDRLRVSVGAGQQVSESTFRQSLTFQQYLEQADLTLERAIPKKVVFDVGATLRIWRGLRAGAAVSAFKANGSGTVTAHVPHPLQFKQPRTTTGEIPGVDRKETATHIQIGWTVPTAGGLEFMPFAGPSILQTEQVFVTKLNVTLANEVFPFDTLAFPGVATETIKDSVMGYNAGVDMTWRFSKNVGIGALIRYSHGTKDYTPTGGQATKVEAGGLQAGGGLRLIF
jgi:hypothetical protein